MVEFNKPVANVGSPLAEEPPPNMNNPISKYVDNADTALFVPGNVFVGAKVHGSGRFLLPLAHTTDEFGNGYKQFVFSVPELIRMYLFYFTSPVAALYSPEIKILRTPIKLQVGLEFSVKRWSGWTTAAMANPYGFAHATISLTFADHGMMVLATINNIMPLEYHFTEGGGFGRDIIVDIPLFSKVDDCKWAIFSINPVDQIKFWPHDADQP